MVQRYPVELLENDRPARSVIFQGKILRYAGKVQLAADLVFILELFDFLGGRFGQCQDFDGNRKIVFQPFAAVNQSSLGLIHLVQKLESAKFKHIYLQKLVRNSMLKAGICPDYPADCLILPPINKKELAIV